jgi:hypothetical protein
VCGASGVSSTSPQSAWSLQDEIDEEIVRAWSGMCLLFAKSLGVRFLDSFNKVEIME